MTSDVRHELLQTLAELGTCHPALRFGQLFEFASLMAAQEDGPGLLAAAKDQDVLVVSRKHIASWTAQEHPPMTGELPALAPLRANLLHALDEFGHRVSLLPLGQVILQLAEIARVNAYDIEDEQLLEAAKGLADRCEQPRTVARLQG